MGNCFGSPADDVVLEPLLHGDVKIREASRLEEDYKIVGGVLGYGRVATVRRGVDRKSGQKVAIKACSKKVLNTRPARISRVSSTCCQQRRALSC
eukprot:jgi/Mesen1/9846/ME000070S09125